MPSDPEKRQEAVEEIEISGNGLLQKVEDLAREGQVRRLRIIEPDGDIAVDVPLTVGAIAGGAVVIAAPVLALIGVIAGLATRVRVQIVRETKAD
ncbi:MAG: DUF4342 domain-containing protein [Roseicyclus sp.]